MAAESTLASMAASRDAARVAALGTGGRHGTRTRRLHRIRVGAGYDYAACRLPEPLESWLGYIDYNGYMEDRNDQTY